MSIFINLASSKAIAQNPANTISDFTQVYSPGISLPGTNFKVGVISFTGWNSRKNISAALGNNKFSYSIDSGVSWKNYTIPDGKYSIEELDTKIKRELFYPNGDFGPNPVTGLTGINDGVVYYITLYPLISENKVQIVIDDPTYQVDLTIADNLAEFLGFTSKIVTATEKGTLEPEVSNGIDSWLLHVDLVSNSYVNERKSDTLLTFIPNAPSQYAFKIEPFNPVFIQVNRQNINSIRVRLTDQNDNTLVLDEGDVTVSLELKQI